MLDLLDCAFWVLHVVLLFVLFQSARLRKFASFIARGHIRLSGPASMEVLRSGLRNNEIEIDTDSDFDRDSGLGRYGFPASLRKTCYRLNLTNFEHFAHNRVRRLMPRT
jgi:hypothetical protein